MKMGCDREKSLRTRSGKKTFHENVKECRDLIVKKSQNKVGMLEEHSTPILDLITLLHNSYGAMGPKCV